MSRGVGVTEAIRAGLPEWTLEGFVGLSLLGDLVVIVPLLALVYASDVRSSLREDGTDRPATLCSDRTAVLVATVFGGLALVVALESVFAAPRPPADLHAITPGEYGFPSGHTMAATVFWGGLALWSTIGRRSTRLAVAGTIASLVGLSRLALGVHYLVDVLASMAFGGGYLAAIVWFARGRPGRAFGVAVAIAVLATIVTGGNERALLALGGTVGAAVGWQVVEYAPVRRRLVDAIGR